MAKLGIGIERSRRLAPALGAMETELGGKHVAPEHRVSIEAIGREQPELVLPQADSAARPHFVSDQTKRRDLVALAAATRSAGSRIKLGVYDPNFPKREL